MTPPDLFGLLPYQGSVGYQCIANPRNGLLRTSNTIRKHTKSPCRCPSYLSVGSSSRTLRIFVATFRRVMQMTRCQQGRQMLGPRVEGCWTEDGATWRFWQLLRASSDLIWQKKNPLKNSLVPIDADIVDSFGWHPSQISRPSGTNRCTVRLPVISAEAGRSGLPGRNGVRSFPWEDSKSAIKIRLIYNMNIYVYYDYICWYHSKSFHHSKKEYIEWFW